MRSRSPLRPPPHRGARDASGAAARCPHVPSLLAGAWSIAWPPRMGVLPASPTRGLPPRLAHGRMGRRGGGRWHAPVLVSGPALRVAGGSPGESALPPVGSDTPARPHRALWSTDHRGPGPRLTRSSHAGSASPPTDAGTGGCGSRNRPSQSACYHGVPSSSYPPIRRCKARGRSDSRPETHGASSAWNTRGATLPAGHIPYMPRCPSLSTSMG